MKITKEDLLNSEFLKQFKDSGELDGFLSELHKRGIEKMLEGELDSHLGYERYSPEGKNTGNSRNGKTEKKIKTGFGESQIEVPRDRDGSFEPAIVPKRKGLAKGIEDLVISLYAKGMGNSDIEEQIREIYDFRLSTSTISNITSKIHQDILEWQSRPLDPVYLIVWMDGIVFKVRQSGKVINKTIYLAVGLNRDGKKEVLGMWLGETESASFWSGVLSDLQSRGLEDILITSTDNLKGFTDAIRSIFTGAVTQICVVHQTRNASRYVVWKDKKAFHSDMKAIYNAPNKMLPGWNWSSLNRNGDQNTPMPSSPGKTTGRNSLIFLSIPWPYEGSSIRPISLKTSIQRSESTQKTRPLSLMIMQ
jgi:putative transposase